jgi:hypothetical protein
MKMPCWKTKWIDLACGHRLATRYANYYTWFDCKCGARSRRLDGRAAGHGGRKRCPGGPACTHRACYAKRPWNRKRRAYTQRVKPKNT